MKKFLFCALICSLAAFVGCQKSEELTVDTVGGEKVVVEANIEGDASTRVSFDATTDANGKPVVKVDWAESGESFRVYGDSGSTNFELFEQVSGNYFEGTLPVDEATYNYWAYYNCSYNGLALEYDVVEQDGTLNSDNVLMMGSSPVKDVKFTFAHQTFILKPTFTINGQVVNAEVTEVKMLNVKDPTTKNNTTSYINATVQSGQEDIYLFVPTSDYYTEGYTFTFYLTVDGAEYESELTLPMTLKGGKLYTATLKLTQKECVLPAGYLFRNAINELLTWETCHVKFVINSYVESEHRLEGTTGAPAYLVVNGDYLEVHTPATEKVVFNSDCSKMFASEEGYTNLANLFTVDFANCDTSRVGNMYAMFLSCNRLYELKNLTNFNTANVTDMSYMFWECGKSTGVGMKALDVSSFDTSNVTTMCNMFRNVVVDAINVSGFNTSKVVDMSSMFNGMSGLTSLDVTSFDTSNVTNMMAMFNWCPNLTTIKLNKDTFKTAKVTTMNSMFSSCNKLTTIDVSGFDTSNVTNMRYMFSDCNVLDLHDEDRFDHFNTEKVTDMAGMFYNCTAATKIDVSSFKTNNVTSMYEMFSGCNNLKILDMHTFVIGETTNITYIFSGVGSARSTDDKTDIFLNQDAYNMLEGAGSEVTGHDGDHAKYIIES